MLCNQTCHARILLPMLASSIVLQVVTALDHHASFLGTLRTQPRYGHSLVPIVVSLPTTGVQPYLDRARLVRDTWAPYFSSVEFFTFDQNLSLPWVRNVAPYGPDEATNKTTGINLAMIPLMLASHPAAPWFMQVDDDTLAIPHEWHEVVKTLDHNKPILAGHCVGYTDAKVAFVTGGAGMLMSSALVRALSPHALRCRHLFNNYTFGDTRIGGCMREVFGESYKSMIMCLQGALQVSTIPDWYGTWTEDVHILSLHIKDEAVFKAVWHDLEPDVAARKNVTPARVRAATERAEGNMSTAAKPVVALSEEGLDPSLQIRELYTCPMPLTIQSWVDTCQGSQAWQLEADVF
eukprot:TRINITY_DN3736_c0_g3_i1.p1 TRINITY_DN3736_c0_g3~~TRINITY_DN3736_c0_g3_i1.p1  ORF type:complete len:364 (-),score=34.82 TRINITY_DN3736_c0_g3_i1:287-1336(-)